MEQKKQAELKSYATLFQDQTSSKTNAELQEMNITAKEFEEDFM